MLSSWLGDRYTDPELFDRERERVFRGRWVCVGRADAVPEPGDFARVDVGGESVLVVRDADRGVRGLINVCRHRGARLCRDERGHLGRSIRCAYHGWTYGLDGTLTAAPQMRDLPPPVTHDRGLHAVAATEWLGYVWLRFGAQPPSLAEQMGPQLLDRFGAVDALAGYGIDALRPVTEIVYDVRANWKLIVENFSECYHCATLHPELTAALPSFRSGYGTVSGRRGADLADGMEGFSLSGRAAAPSLPGLVGEAAHQFNAVNLWPNAVLVLLPDHVVWLRLEPLAVDRTRVVAEWLFHPTATANATATADPAGRVADAVALLDIANRQDFEAAERCQLGARSAFYEAVYPPHEHVLLDFHRWVEQAVRAPAPHRQADALPVPTTPR
ncbi:aromatic ring-hydroxylating dioxygenase subunit alpha [Streptomyces sp. NPDC057702]|uniref:aromatic ring-hydroxylating oxygenase subunit alpha n=1 Tax=unclassified Streptomyces TaxID=2593676 RepID=UPI0036BE8658